MKTIIVRKPLWADEVVLGRGARLNIENASVALLNFLREKYLNDEKCTSGDINYLFSANGNVIEKDSEEIYENYELLMKHI